MGTRNIGLTPRAYTTTQLTDLVTRFGPAGSAEQSAIAPGTIVRDKTLGTVKVFNGVAFVAGTDIGASAGVGAGTVTITGTLTAGSTLTAVPGTWTGTPTPVLAYQWKKNGTAVAGATGTTFVAQTGAITVTVTGNNGIGAPVSATSAVSTVV
jgi:hypothetical protein